MLKKHGKTYFSNRFLWNIIGFELTLAIQNVRKTGVEPARTRAVPKWLAFVWDCTQLFEWYHTSWESRPQPVSTHDRRYWHVFALTGFCFCSSDWIFKKLQTQLSRVLGDLGMCFWSSVVWVLGGPGKSCGVGRSVCSAQHSRFGCQEFKNHQDSSRFTSEKWAVWSTMWSEL